MENKMTPERLFEEASEKFYKVKMFDPKAKKSDKTWIRVGLIPEPNKEIRWNFFNGEKMISDDPFDKAEVFENGRSIVTRDHKNNVLRDDGTFVFNEWYSYIYQCEPDKYLVDISTDNYGLSRKEAFADKDGNIISEWYDNIMPMMHKKFYCVGSGERIPERKYAVYNLDTQSVVSGWYDSMMMFQWEYILGKPFARATKEGMHNLVSEDGNPVFTVWSKKPVEVSKDGSCQLFTVEGVAYNANVLTGEMKEI